MQPSHEKECFGKIKIVSDKNAILNNCTLITLMVNVSFELNLVTLHAS